MNALQGLAATIAARKGAAKVPMKLTRTGENTLSLSIPAAGFHGQADIWLVTFLDKRSTKVSRGENSGRELTDYNIVRTLKRIGRWNGEAMEMTLPLDESGDDGCAVLLQTADRGAILGAAKEVLSR